MAIYVISTERVKYMWALMVVFQAEEKESRYKLRVQRRAAIEARKRDREEVKQKRKEEKQEKAEQGLLLYFWMLTVSVRGPTLCVRIWRL